MKNTGPKACGMPEAGYLPIPKKLAKQGVKDMVRVSDARMSGTAFGTVRSGDRIRLSVKDKRIDLLVEDSEIKKRLAGHPGPEIPARGYRALYQKTVTQAPEGCDFDFLAEPKP